MNNSRLRWLLESGDEMAWVAPGRYVLSWPLPPNRPYDIVTSIIADCELPAGKWGVKVDPAEAREHFQDFCPEVRDLLDMIDTSVKWQLAELPPLKTCRSENGKVVLIGDAFHAMIPHSASGGNSAIEDAACIAECLVWAARMTSTGKTSLDKALSLATQAFEDIRKPRVERMQEASHEGFGFLGASEDFLPIRDQALADATKMYDELLALPEEERRSMPKATPDMKCRFPLEPYLQWLYGYDTIEATKNHLAHVQIV